MAALKKIFDFHIVLSNEEAKVWMEANSKCRILNIYPWGGKLVIWYSYFEEIKTDAMQAEVNSTEGVHVKQGN